jgi:hypothetical protein
MISHVLNLSSPNSALLCAPLAAANPCLIKGDVICPGNEEVVVVIFGAGTLVGLVVDTADENGELDAAGEKGEVDAEEICDGFGGLRGGSFVGVAIAFFVLDPATDEPC